jgi:hypothetical protein
VIGVFCWAMPAWGSGKSAIGTQFHLLNPGTAIADLDGDHLPDLASGTNLGRTPEGYAYRVDLDLTSTLHSRPFSVFSAESSGVNIEAIDLDGDHDLDLVITSRILQKPIGVWLNDGRGNFTRGDSSQFASAFFRQRESLRLPTTPPQAVDFQETQRAQVFLTANRINGPPLRASADGLPSDLSAAISVSAESARLRAPPTL